MYDAEHARWLSHLKDRMHKLAMDGLRRPSENDLPEAVNSVTQHNQDSGNTVAALQRWVLHLQPCMHQAWSIDSGIDFLDGEMVE